MRSARLMCVHVGSPDMSPAAVALLCEYVMNTNLAFNDSYTAAAQVGIDTTKVMAGMRSI